MGKWFGFWTKQVYSGENTYTVNMPLDHVPLFIKDNSILPLK